MKNKTNTKYMISEKLRKLMTEQKTLIEMLSDYYRRTEYISELNFEVQEEMFPDNEPVPCVCEECDNLVYPIETFIQKYQFVLEKFDSLEIEEIDINLDYSKSEEKSSSHLLNS